MKILLVDNYDSFTYNIVHYIEGVDEAISVDVVFNDQIDFSILHKYDKIVLSPGPGLPEQAGGMMELIKRVHTVKPLLGVCLGFQAIVEFFGGQIYNQKEVKHGVRERCVFDDTSRLFKNTSPSFNVGLYHSWAVNKARLPNVLEVTATSENDVIMAIEHQVFPICGVQFHPESIMTENGHQIIRNFLLNF